MVDVLVVLSAVVGACALIVGGLTARTGASTSDRRRRLSRLSVAGALIVVGGYALVSAAMGVAIPSPVFALAAVLFAAQVLVGR